MLLRNARLPDGSLRDLVICEQNGEVCQVGPPGELPAGPGASDGVNETLGMDLSGFVLLPAPAEPHAHLDKALTWDQVGAPPGDLPSAITAWHGYARHVTEEDIASRARRALAELAMNGVTAVRSHVDLLPGSDPFRGLRALLRLRDDPTVGHTIRLQVAVLYAQAPLSLLREALRMGVDVLGGCPHLTADPAAAIDDALRLAEEFGVPLDLHADENLDPHSQDLRLLAERVGLRSWGVPRVTASHCASLGSVPDSAAAAIAKEVAAAGIGVVTLPLTNLGLLGRDHPAPRPRGLTALRALLDAGVAVAAGGDNTRDPFNPVGSLDALQTAALLVSAGHLTPAEALHAVTSGARAVLGLPPAGPWKGAAADLLAVRAASLSEALSAACPERVVFRGGRLVSRTQVTRELF